MHQSPWRRSLAVGVMVLSVLVVIAGTLGAALCSGCDRYPMRVAVRRVSDGQRVAVPFHEHFCFYPVSDNYDRWPEMVAGISYCSECRVVAYADFVFLVDIDFPMEAGASEDSVLISFDQFYGRVDSMVRVYLVEKAVPTANTTVPWQIAEVPIEVEIPRKGRVVVAPVGGEFPQRSCLVLALDLGSGLTEATTPPSAYRGGYFARVCTLTDY